MTQPLQKKISTSKKWIDYSSDQQIEHHEEQREKKASNKNQDNHKKLESRSFQQEKKKNLPVLSSSHEPVTKHLIESRKQQLASLRQMGGNTLWIQLSVQDQKSLPYLNQKIDSLRDQNNKKIYSIYTSREKKLAFDVKLKIDLCQKWIVEGFETKNIIKIELNKKISGHQYEKNDSKNQKQYYKPKNKDDQQKNRDYQQKHKQYQQKNREYETRDKNYGSKIRGYEPKHKEFQSKHKGYDPKHNGYENKDRQFEKNTKNRDYEPKNKDQKDKNQYHQEENRDYRPVKQQHPKHTTSTRFQSKQTLVLEKQTQFKKKYIEKNPLIQKLQQKVEEQLAQKKLRKDKPKKDKTSKFYSKNPFQTFDQSD